LAYLPSRFALFILGIGVIQLFQTNVTLCTVGIFKAAVQTVVAHTVAVAITRLLVQNCWNLFGELVGMGLKIILGIRSPKLFLAQRCKPELSLAAKSPKERTERK